MTPGLRRLPVLLLVAVRAFAPFERRPLLGAVQLFRGLSVQLAYRWGTGQVRADVADRAVLLWSSVGLAAGWPRRSGAQLRGLLSGVVVGMGLFLVSNGLLLGLLVVGGELVGVGWGIRAVVVLVVAVLRLVMTFLRAVVALVATRRWVVQLPHCKRPRWRVDYLAAYPSGTGSGGRLLSRFVAEADSQDVEVVLVCDTGQRAFYRRHGFRVVPSVELGPVQVVMRRVAPSERGVLRGVPAARQIPEAVPVSGVPGDAGLVRGRSRH